MELAPGAVVLDRYRIESVLGKGGQATVYAAVHLRLGTRVAIKVLGNEGNTVDELRLESEARLGAALESPHIVKALDVATLANGQSVIVFERLDGRNLAAEIAARDGEVPAREIVRWATEIASALEVAHRAGVIHRDIKPSNVFITGATKTARVLDFGIARDPSAGVALTAPGTIIGTPKYMSPEQLRGLPDIDARADVFALGVMLYRFFASTLPFAGDSPGELLASMDRTAPALSSIRPDLPRDLCAAIDRAIVPAREARWPTITALRDALRPFATPHHEHGAAIAIKAALVTVVVGALAGGAWLASRSPASVGDASDAGTAQALADASLPSPSPSASPSTEAPSPPVLAIAEDAAVITQVPLASASQVAAKQASAPVGVAVNGCVLLDSAACRKEERELSVALASCGPLLPMHRELGACIVNADVGIDPAGQPTVEVLMRPGHPCAGLLTAQAKQCLERGLRARRYPADTTPRDNPRTLLMTIWRATR